MLLYNEFSVCLTLIYIFTPFAALSIYASLERIPTSIIESARDLGASSWEIFARIVWPLSVPGVVAGAIIASSLAFGDFIAPALVGGPSGIMITNIVVNLLGVAFDWPMAAAIGVVTIFLGLLLISIAQYFEHLGRCGYEAGFCQPCAGLDGWPAGAGISLFAVAGDGVFLVQ